MIKISRKVEYALMALQHMHGQPPEQVVSAKDLCATYRVAFPVLSKVLQNLAAAGVLRSAQGAHGGYQLARPLSDVTFGELSAAVVGPMQFAYCLHHDRGALPTRRVLQRDLPHRPAEQSHRGVVLQHELGRVVASRTSRREAAIRARHRVAGS